jgi:hypothetical protein
MSAGSKRLCKFGFAAAIAIMVAGAPSSLLAQAPESPNPPQQPPPQAQQALTQQQLQQLVAPIALYPDALLAQVLTASTYPLEVAMAARWSEKNSDVKGTALEDAMQKQPWDASVRGLTAVPQVLAMMNEKLDWTSQLGEAFLAQPDDVQNAVQALRKQADLTVPDLGGKGARGSALGHRASASIRKRFHLRVKIFRAGVSASGQTSQSVWHKVNLGTVRLMCNASSVGV